MYCQQTFCKWIEDFTVNHTLGVCDIPAMWLLKEDLDC